MEGAEQAESWTAAKGAALLRRPLLVAEAEGQRWPVVQHGLAARPEYLSVVEGAVLNCGSAEVAARSCGSAGAGDLSYDSAEAAELIAVRKTEVARRTCFLSSHPLPQSSLASEAVEVLAQAPVPQVPVLMLAGGLLYEQTCQHLPTVEGP